MRHKNEKNTSFSLQPRRGYGWGRGKEAQKCCGLSSKELTNTARKTESETTRAKLKRKGKKTLRTWAQRRDGCYPLPSYTVWQPRKDLSVLEDGGSNTIFWDPKEEPCVPAIGHPLLSPEAPNPCKSCHTAQSVNPAQQTRECEWPVSVHLQPNSDSLPFPGHFPQHCQAQYEDGSGFFSLFQSTSKDQVRRIYPM